MLKLKNHIKLSRKNIWIIEMNIKISWNLIYMENSFRIIYFNENFKTIKDKIYYLDKII